VGASEALEMGLANRVVPTGSSRGEAQALAHQVALFPQTCMREDRLSLLESLALNEADALASEFRHGIRSLEEVAGGLERFRSGAGRHGSFED